MELKKPSIRRKEELLPPHTHIAKQLKMPVAEVRNVLNAYTDYTCLALERGNSVKMHGVVVFGVYTRKARRVRLNGELTTVPARKSVRATFSRVLLRRLRKS